MSKREKKKNRWGGYWGARSDDSDDDECAGGRVVTVRAPSDDDEPGVGEEDGKAKPKRFSRCTGITPGYTGMMASVGLTADLRKSGELPEGVEVVGGDVNFEEQEDGDSALVLPEGAYLKFATRMPGWMLEDDGRLHRYSICVAMRLDRLPPKPLPLLNGGAPPQQGETTESVTIYKEGGVGALGQVHPRTSPQRDRVHG